MRVFLTGEVRVPDALLVREPAVHRGPTELLDPGGGQGDLVHPLACGRECRGDVGHFLLFSFQPR